MKRLSLLVLVVFSSMSLGLFQAKGSVTNPSSNSIVTDMQQNDWVELGKITAHSVATNTGEYTYWNIFTLYARVFGGKTFYKVTNYDGEFSVSCGKFTCNGKAYNACFSWPYQNYGNKWVTWYFNI